MIYSPIASQNPEPTIAQRTAMGAASYSTQERAIVPALFSKIPIPNALSGNQGGIGMLLSASFMETRHVYRSPDGQEIMAVLRYDKGGEKTFRPLRCVGKAADGRTLFAVGALEGLRPLYNLHQLASRPEAPVLLVEGEKTADAAAALFPNYVCTTWPGGAKSVAKIDWRDLAGRRVCLWPDHDKAGEDAMPQAAGILAALGCELTMVAVPDSYPSAWDLADPVPANLTAGHKPTELLASASPFVAKPNSAARTAAAARAVRGDLGGEADMHRFFCAARFLGTTGRRSYAPGGGYPDWFDLMCASKNGFGEKAFGEFCKLSWEYGGQDSEEDTRRRWDSLKELPKGTRLTPATFFAEALAAGWEDTTASPGAGQSSNRVERADPASVVLEQAAEAGDVLWLDQYGKPHVSMVVEGSDGVERMVHARVGGKRHKGAVSRRYRLTNKNKVLSAEQEKRAMLLLEHEAREGGIEHVSANRVAEHEGCIYVDLGRVDGKTVSISGDGWAVVENAPVRFVRGNRGELPLPESGGTLADFQRHLNLAPTDVVRVIAFVLGALAPLASFPILLIEGRQGTAKSTIGDMVLQLCDPPYAAKGGRLTMPRGEQNLLVHATGVRVVYIDNVSDITAAEADALCRLATGGGTSARQHYTDEDEVQLNAVRPTIVTCIGTPSGRGDFLDRCVRVTALPIEHRRTEEAVQRAFVADQPRMLGFVLDALAAALGNKSEMDRRSEAGEMQLARMADFALYVEGAAEVIGLEPGQFSASLADEQATMQAEGALGEPLGEAIARYFSAGDRNRSVLEGHATEFLDDLRPFLLDPTQLPASNKLKGALRRIEPGLKDLGILVHITEASKGVRNRKSHYRISITDAFQLIGEKLPF